MPIHEIDVSTSQARIRVRQSGGVGLPLVMLHGNGSSDAVFRRQFDSPLSESHRLIAINLPGHGASGDAFDPDPTYTPTGLAKTIGETLDKLAIRRAAIFGWSLGGHVAMELAGFHPAVAGLFLVGAPPVPPGSLGLLRGFHANFDLLLTSKKTFTERDVERFARLCFGDHADADFLAAIRRSDGRLRANFVKSMLRGDGMDQRRFVETTSIPTAILNGAVDPFVRLNYIDGLSYGNLWRQRCHVFPATGHAPFWHAPQLFNPLLAAFAADVAARPRLDVLRQFLRSA